MKTILIIFRTSCATYFSDILIRMNKNQNLIFSCKQRGVGVTKIIIFMLFGMIITEGFILGVVYGICYLIASLFGWSPITTYIVLGGFWVVNSFAIILGTVYSVFLGCLSK